MKQTHSMVERTIFHSTSQTQSDLVQPKTATIQMMRLVCKGRKEMREVRENEGKGEWCVGEGMSG